MTRPRGHSPYYGYGRVNAGRAVREALAGLSRRAARGSQTRRGRR